MSESPDFSTVQIPTGLGDSFPQETGAQTSDDPTCEVCGVPLTYSGRGRRPKYCDEHKRSSGKSSGGTRRGSADVELAVATLHNLYEGITFPLILLSPPGAEEWQKQIDGLDERNRMFLATNKDLVRKINAMATKGGNFAFVFSHLIAVAPVVGVVRHDFAMRALAREAEAYAQGGDETGAAGGGF